MEGIKHLPKQGSYRLYKLLHVGCEASIPGQIKVGERDRQGWRKRQTTVSLIGIESTAFFPYGERRVFVGRTVEWTGVPRFPHWDAARTGSRGGRGYPKRQVSGKSGTRPEERGPAKGCRSWRGLGRRFRGQKRCSNWQNRAYFDSISRNCKGMARSGPQR
jgi:hypothetical protein